MRGVCLYCKGPTQQCRCVCDCGHLKNTHIRGAKKCMFAELEAVHGGRGEPCFCESFHLHTAESEEK